MDEQDRAKLMDALEVAARLQREISQIVTDHGALTTHAVWARMQEYQRVRAEQDRQQSEQVAELVRRLDTASARFGALMKRVDALEYAAKAMEAAT